MQIDVWTPSVFWLKFVYQLLQ